MREGRNESESVRVVLTEAGRRRRQHSALAEEVRRVTADEADRAELARIMADMESVAPEWPE